MKVAYEHVIPAPVEQVFETYGKEEFYIARQKSLGALSVEVLTWETDSEGKVRMEVRVSEPSKQPSFIRNSDVDTYVDEGLWDPGERTLTWRIKPSVGADKFVLRGKIEFHPDGDATRVVYHIDIQVKIPIFGKKAEKFALSKTEGETARQAAFLKDWVKNQNS
jgi:hypothetical protein